jgi:hypothetical protein
MCSASVRSHEQIVRPDHLRTLLQVGPDSSVVFGVIRGKCQGLDMRKEAIQRCRVLLRPR